MLTATGGGGCIGADPTVLTVHALEQVGAGWQPFVDFVIARRPRLCVHLEPLVELYETAPLDDLARRYHRKRRYLDGFVPAIKALAAHGRAEILTLRRTAFSGL